MDVRDQRAFSKSAVEEVHYTGMVAIEQVTTTSAITTSTRVSKRDVVRVVVSEATPEEVARKLKLHLSIMMEDK